MREPRAARELHGMATIIGRCRARSVIPGRPSSSLRAGSDGEGPPLSELENLDVKVASRRAAFAADLTAPLQILGRRQIPALADRHCASLSASVMGTSASNVSSGSTRVVDRIEEVQQSNILEVFTHRRH